MNRTHTTEETDDPKGADNLSAPFLRALHNFPAVPVFTKTGADGTGKIWLYDMKADGLSLDDKRSETTENDIHDILARFANLEDEADRAKTQQSFFSNLP